MKKYHIFLLLSLPFFLGCQSPINNDRGTVEMELKEDINKLNIDISSSSSDVIIEGNKILDWNSKKTNDASLEIDLKEVRKINSATQIFKSDDIWYFKVLGSIDGEQYFELIDNSFGVYGQVFSEAAFGYARYIKLEVYKSEKGYEISSEAFYVDTSSLSEGKNIALGLKGDSSTRSGGYEASKAYDGDEGNYWCAANGGFPQWISGELASPQYVKNIEIVLHDNGTFQFEVEIRKKSGEWFTLCQKSIQSGNYFSFAVNEEIDAWVFRVFYGPGWANVAEIKVNGFETFKGNESEVIDLGTSTYIHQVNSDSDVYYSNDGNNFVKFNNNTNENIICRYIKGLGNSGFLYGYKLENLLNHLFSAEVTDYSDEGHHISNASLSDNHVDANISFYQSDTKGEEVFIKYDLGRNVLINKVVYEFNESSNHIFKILTSQDDIDYEVLEQFNGSLNKARYEIIKDQSIYARYVKLVANLNTNEQLTAKRFQIYGNGSSKRENWWQDQSGVIRFYPKEQKTTLKEINSRLDEFRYSGYRVIELHQPYEGLADIWAGLGGTNNFQVDPIIGDLDDLRLLLNNAHKKGIRIFMFGNVGYGKNTSDCFQKACRDYAMGISSKEVDYFLFSKTCPDSTKWFWSDIANAYYYGYWGEDGQIPTYNFNNKEWQDETYRYIKFWSDFGMDGIALDAPNVYYYGSENAASVTFKCITKTLRSKNIFSLPEGSGDVGFISGYRYCGVQNYNITSWGAGALSLGLIAAQTHSASQVDDYVKSVRDSATALGGIAIGGMNFEDNYENASHMERVLESALVTTTGHMAFLHIGSSAKIGQDIMKTWPIETQMMVARSFALQNSVGALHTSGERTKLFTNSDSKYYAFYRSDMTGRNKAMVVINYVDADTIVEVDISHTPLDKEGVEFYDAYNHKVIDAKPVNGVIKIRMNKNSHRVLIVR